MFHNLSGERTNAVITVATEAVACLLILKPTALPDSFPQIMRVENGLVLVMAALIPRAHN